MFQRHQKEAGEPDSDDLEREDEQYIQKTVDQSQYQVCKASFALNVLSMVPLLQLA